LKFDDFLGSSLDAYWTTINGNQPGNSIYLSGNCLVEYASQSNNLGWGSNRAPITLSANPVTTDFDFRAKISWYKPPGGSSGVGIVVYQSFCDWTYIDQFPEGKVVVEYSIACSERDNAADVFVTINPIWLRIVRAGTQYTYYYSYDGTNWFQNGAFNLPNINPSQSRLGFDTRSWFDGQITSYYDWAVIYAPGVNGAVTITSSPTGSGFVSVDDSPITTPQTFTWLMNSQHSVSAQSPVACGSGCQYVWQSWSDAGAQSHQITVQSQSATLTAIFQQQYSLTISAGSGGTTNPAPGTSWISAGQDVSISATPSQGYLFNGWILDGQNAGNSNPISITMNQPHTLIANFAPPGSLCPYVNTEPPGLTPQPSQVPNCPIAAGTQVTITAQPIPNWKFENFTVSGVTFTQNGNVVTFIMPSSPVAVIARYSSAVVPPAQGIAIPAYNMFLVLLWGVGSLLLLFLALKRRKISCRRQW
jgi:hypothetical protein